MAPPSSPLDDSELLSGLAPGQHVVYHITDRSTGALLYVGRSCRPDRRRYEHQSGGMYPDATCEFKVMSEPMCLDDVARREIEDIRRLNPRDNAIGRLEPLHPHVDRPWWVCPNGVCEHGANLHDVEDITDTEPRCCVEGCKCGTVAA